MSGKDGAHAKRRASPARVRTSRTAVDLAQPVAVASTAAAPPAPPRTPGRKARAPSPHASRRVAAAASGAPAIGAHDSSLNADAVVAARGSPRDGASDAASSIPTPLHASGAVPGKGALSNANDVGNAVPVQGGVRGGVAPPHEEEEEVSRAQHHHHRAHKHKLAQSTSRRRAVLLVLGGLLLALLGSLGVDTAYCLVNKLPWAVSRALPSVRNPAWREARFREMEHATSPQFLQWYHTTISDAATRRVFSFGFGKSLQEGRAGGWLRVKGLHDDEYSTHAWPEQWLPVTALHALGGINVDIVVDNDGANVTLFSQRALGDNQVQVWAHWPHTGDAVNLTLTRTYGTSLKSEDCTLSNIPFAYASSVHGFIRIGGQTFEFDTSPRYRAYVESTWGCTVPRSNIPGADASAYPWKWMWLTLPVGAHGNANVPGVPAGRRGVIDGEVGAVISSARFEDSKLGTLTATFAYIDLPTFRVSSTNVTLENLLPTQVPLLLATEKNAGYVMRTEMKHADFMPFTDALGPAQVPRTQTLSVGTTLFEAVISFSTHPTDYVRLPLRYVDDEGKWQVCSAFRATHSRASLYVARKLTRIEVLALREGTPARGIHATAINELAASIDMPVKELLAKDVDANIVPCKTMPSRTPNETDMCLTLVESRVDHNALEFAYHAPYAQPNTSTDGSLLAVENTTPDAVVMVSEAGADLVKPGEQGSAAMLTLDASALDGTDLLPPSSAMADSLPHTTTSEEVDASGARGSEYIADATFAPAQHVPEYTAPMHAGDDEEGHHHPPTSAHAPTQPHTASASSVPAEPGHANTVEEAAAIELAQELEDGARAAVHASHGSSAAARATPTLEPMELGDPTPLSHKRQHAASDDAAQPAATSGMEQPAPPPAPTLP